MKYRTMGKTGIEVSVLGYGCMRYPKKNGRVDEARTIAQIRSAMDAGVNYFDTAYVYLGGQSETVLGKAIAGRRERLFIADKIPPYLVFSPKDPDRLLETMLKRLATDRVDFLLAHALTDHASWERLASLGYVEFLERAKKDGRIRFAGFSWHGKLGEFKKLVDAYDWDFCQIQYNYLDEHFQAGREGLAYAAAKGLGVAVMEPLRGGSLVGKVPQSVAAIMDRAATKRSPAGWALDWIWDHPEVGVVLSGLNHEAHIAENIALASASAPNSFAPEETELIARVRDEFRALMKVGCTGCAYCMPCPYGVDIPNVFSMHNSLYLFDDRHMRFQYTAFTSGIGSGKATGASACTECGACVKKCPQHLHIPSLLKAAERDLAMPLLRPLIGVLGLVMRLRSGRKKRVPA